MRRFFWCIDINIYFAKVSLEICVFCVTGRNVLGHMTSSIMFERRTRFNITTVLDKKPRQANKSEQTSCEISQDLILWESQKSANLQNLRNVTFMLQWNCCTPTLCLLTRVFRSLCIVSGAQAWHAWAVMNFEAVLHYKHENQGRDEKKKLRHASGASATSEASNSDSEVDSNDHSPVPSPGQKKVNEVRSKVSFSARQKSCALSPLFKAKTFYIVGRC